MVAEVEFSPFLVFFYVQEYDEGGKLNNMNAARYCLLLLAFLFRKITHTMRIFHSER